MASRSAARPRFHRRRTGRRRLRPRAARVSSSAVASSGRDGGDGSRFTGAAGSRARGTKELDDRNRAGGARRTPGLASASAAGIAAPLAAAFFLSGFAALIYELLWFRLLGHVFG